VDITVRDGLTLEEAITEAKQNDTRRKEVGYDQMALDNAASLGFRNGTFEDSEEEIVELIDEFFPETDAIHRRNGDSSGRSAGTVKDKSSLMTKLDNKIATLLPASQSVAQTQNS